MDELARVALAFGHGGAEQAVVVDLHEAALHRDRDLGDEPSDPRHALLRAIAYRDPRPCVVDGTARHDAAHALRTALAELHGHDGRRRHVEDEVPSALL